MTSDELAIEKTVIANVGCIAHLEINHTSPVLVVTGDNGTGKTSIANAFSLLFDRDSRPELIRDGEKKATVTITLSNGMVLTRTQTANEATYRVTDRAGAVIRKPATYVQGLLTGLALNPMRLLTAEPKERRQVLQQIMPVRFTKAEIDAACGYDSFVITHDGLDIDQFDALVEGTRLKRRDENHTVKQLEATLQTFRQTTPAATDDRDWKAEVSRLDEEEKRRMTRLTSLRHEAAAAIDREIAQARQEFDSLCECIRRKGAQLLEEQEAPIMAERDRIREELTLARDARMNQARLLGARAQIETLDKQHLEALRSAEKFDRAVRGLEKLRLDRLAEMPIAGLELRGGEIYFDDRPFDSLNLQKRVFLACRIAARVDRGLRFFVLDDFEHVTTTNAEEFYRGTKAAGFQVMVMRAEAGKPLQIEAR